MTAENDHAKFFQHQLTDTEKEAGAKELARICERTKRLNKVKASRDDLLFFAIPIKKAMLEVYGGHSNSRNNGISRTRNADI